MITSVFKYECLEFVTIKSFGLNYKGRVVRCIIETGGIIYDVQYAVDGRLKRDEFYEDELEKE